MKQIWEMYRDQKPLTDCYFCGGVLDSDYNVTFDNDAVNLHFFCPECGKKYIVKCEAFVIKKEGKE